MHIYIHYHIQWHPPLDLITVFDVIALFREVSIGYLQRVQLANRGCLLIWTPGPVPFGTCICSYVEIIIPEFVMSTDHLLVDTWFRPLFWDLLVPKLLRPDSANLPCLYSTFHLEYPWYFLGFASNNSRYFYFAVMRNNYFFLFRRRTMYNTVMVELK